MNADAAGVLSDAFVKLLNATQAERVAAALERENTEKRIDAMEAAHEQQITELRVRITDNGLETQKKITELQEQFKDASKKYRIMKGIAEKLVRALQNNDPPIPIPDLNGDLAELGETGKDLKLTREERERLKGAGK